MKTKPLCVLAIAIGAWAAHAKDTDARPPNIVVIFTDDQGYGDLACYGHPTIATPHLDGMAAEGMKLVQFYVPSPVCSPSRAALLTGCYPKRVGMHEHVIFPDTDYGLHTDEVTIADMLVPLGYATACIGKWHLGHRPGLMPTDQGFGSFFGIPYSNDMSTFHRGPEPAYRFNLPLMRDDKVVAWEPDQHLLTKRLTEEATRFIRDHKDRPFFLYLAHPMPHIPLFASESFENTSDRGRYGDVIEEIDWSVGQILASLDACGIDDDTFVLFTSDNGPWKRHRQEGGSAGPLRGGKQTNFEGGQREPCIVRWPGHVPAGTVCRHMTTSMDILPTIAEFTGAPLPARTLDGKSLGRLLTSAASGAAPPHTTFLYYTADGDLAGIRKGDKKLLFAGKEAADGPLLFDVAVDISEEWNLAADEPEVVASFKQVAQDLDAEITANARPVRHVEDMLWSWPRQPSPREAAPAP